MPVWLAVPAPVTSTAAWPGKLARLHRMAVNARLAGFSAFFASPGDFQQGWPKLAAQLGGVIVVPWEREDGELFIGTPEQRQADYVHALGKPVLVLAAGGLVPWPAFACGHKDSCHHPDGLPVHLRLRP